MAEKIVFETEDGQVEFYVIEETRMAGENYLLVSDGDIDDEDAELFVLHDTSDESDTEAAYEVVEDEDTLTYLEPIFEALLNDEDDFM